MANRMKRMYVGLLALLTAFTTMYIWFDETPSGSSDMITAYLTPYDAPEASSIAASLRLVMLQKRHEHRIDPWLLDSEPDEQKTQHDLNVHTKSLEERFLYVTQTEECLPSHFRRRDQLGPDGKTFDFLVLSWKSNCTDAEQHYPNVKYIYPGRNTTWSTGRNILFTYITKEAEKYLYYVFMDDDVLLNYTAPRQVYYKESFNLNERLQHMVTEKYLKFHKHSSVGNPYRDFERFLTDYSPAVGLVNFCFEGRRGCVSNYYPDIWDSLCRDEGDLPFPYISYSTFDAAFNAFHRDAISHLLPYHVTYESVNWQESQKYLILQADIKYQGQVLYDMFIMGNGMLHRSYPRTIHWLQNWEEVLEDLRPHINPAYWNTSEVVPLRVSGRRFDEIRNPLPPRSPIVPYRHYRLNRTRSCHHKPNTYSSYNT